MLMIMANDDRGKKLGARGRFFICDSLRYLQFSVVRWLCPGRQYGGTKFLENLLIFH
jgi:hypothetical protein